ncbi:MAG: hypothetical protein LQ345_007072 [Seirophora villosa]|nr:MAG: hypothetical protein LQ345_007072 [Seirophora villosa]
MASELPPSPHNRKRKATDCEAIVDPVPEPASKRQKQRQTIASFWDNLSRLWLTRRALEEFGRRISKPVSIERPVHPIIDTPTKKKFNLADLQRFARHGGPDLSDLRGYPSPTPSLSLPPIMEPSQSGSNKRMKTREEPGHKSSAYDANFRQNLKDHGVIVDNLGVKPANWAAIHSRLAQRRDSLSSSRFSDVDFEKFQRANDDAASEDGVKMDAFLTIAGTAAIPHQGDKLFNNLFDFPGGEIAVAQPDWYDGADPSELRKEIRRTLSRYIEPSKNDSLPMLPNFFAEVKGPDGSSRVVMLQALQDATLGARGILAIRGYSDPSTQYNNDAYTIAATYHPDGTLAIYTMHVEKVTGQAYQEEYRLTKLRSFNMTDIPERFREGATFLRNARDLAKEFRDRHIAMANNKAQSAPSSGLLSSGTMQSDGPPRPDSDTSSDELSLGDGPQSQVYPGKRQSGK